MSDLRNYVGERGEILFAKLITKWCDGEPWFTRVVFQGEKAPTRDYTVELVEPTSGHAVLFVQVKATRGKYTGSGKKRRLSVKLSQSDMARLKRSAGPAFVVGIDIDSDLGYLVQISAKSPRSFSSLSLRHPINCRTIKKLWEQIDAYWIVHPMLPPSSRFEG